MKKAYKTIKSQELVLVQQQPTTLDFSNQVLRFSDIIKIAGLLSSNKVTHADFSNTVMTPDMADILKLALKNCNSITHLKLSGSTLFQYNYAYSDGSLCENASVHSIAKTIASHPIQELILDGALTTPESISAILDTVPSMKYLTHLNISNSMFSGASVYQLSSCLQHKSLKKITMDHVVIPSPQDMELFRDIVIAILSINKPLTVSLVNLYSHQGSAPDSPKIPAVEALKAFGYEKFVKYFEAVDKILAHFFPNDVREIIYDYAGEPEPLLLFGEDSGVELV